MRQQRSGASAWRSKRGTSILLSSSRAMSIERPMAAPMPCHRGLDQHAVEAKARGPRQVRRGLALTGEPVRPVGVPSQVVEQGRAAELGRRAGLAALKVASLGTSHFSATASTETMRTRRGQRRWRSETPWTSARMRCTSFR